MSSYSIIGSEQLEGEILISGNKNGSLACIAATLLTDKEVILNNVPAIEDVKVLIEILKRYGSDITYLDKNRISFKSNLDYSSDDISPNDELIGSIRASILLIGPLLTRTGKIALPPPGGDVIGFRRLDTHFNAFEELGAHCNVTEEGILKASANKKVVGANILLDEASVTGTENIVMASVLAKGKTVITNAASEPHVQDLCNLLVAMGSKIEGIGSNLLTIEGVANLNGAEFTIGSDYMEVGSFIGLAAATKSEIELIGCDSKHLPMIEKAYKRLGISWYESGKNKIVIPKKQSCIIKKSIDDQTLKIDDAPWPGFPADLMSIITVVATQMNGTILIHEKMYESRLYFVDWLIRMGADIILCDPHRALINGPVKLKANQLSSPDVRAGMALVIAALCAQGVSTIQNIYQIERGYEDLHKKLLGVGAKIVRSP